VRRQWFLLGLLLLLLSAAAVGCGSVPGTHYYMLEFPHDLVQPSAGAQAEGLIIGVRDFRVDPPYDRDTLVYRVGQHPTEVGFYDYHRWAAPLERMLPVVVARGLDTADGSTVVEPFVSDRPYDALLYGRVISIEEVDYPDRQDVVIRLELILRSPEGTQFWSRVGGGQQSVVTHQVGAIAETMNSVLRQLINELRPAFVQALEEFRTTTDRLP
jgi:uncharacterized lipoprotein YmbA